MSGAPYIRLKWGGGGGGKGRGGVGQHSRQQYTVYEEYFKELKAVQITRDIVG